MEDNSKSKRDFTYEINKFYQNIHKYFPDDILSILKDVGEKTKENHNKLSKHKKENEYDGIAFLNLLLKSEKSFKAEDEISNEEEFKNILDICFYILKTNISQDNYYIQDNILKNDKLLKLLCSFNDFSGINHKIIHIHDVGLDPRLDDTLAIIIIMSFSILVKMRWNIEIKIIYIAVGGNNETRKLRARLIDCLRLFPNNTANFKTRYLPYTNDTINFPSYPYALSTLDSSTIIKLNLTDLGNSCENDGSHTNCGLYISGYMIPSDHKKIQILIDGNYIGQVFAQTIPDTGNFNINKDYINSYLKLPKFLCHGKPISLSTKIWDDIYSNLPIIINDAHLISLGTMVCTEQATFNRPDKNGNMTTAVMRSLNISGTQYDKWIELNFQMLHQLKLKHLCKI